MTKETTRVAEWCQYDLIPLELMSLCEQLFLCFSFEDPEYGRVLQIKSLWNKSELSNSKEVFASFLFKRAASSNTTLEVSNKTDWVNGETKKKFNNDQDHWRCKFTLAAYIEGYLRVDLRLCADWHVTRLLIPDTTLK